MLFHLFVAVCCAKIGASISEISSHQPFHYNKGISELSANLYFLCMILLCCFLSFILFKIVCYLIIATYNVFQQDILQVLLCQRYVATCKYRVVLCHAHRKLGWLTWQRQLKYEGLPGNLGIIWKVSYHTITM